MKILYIGPAFDGTGYSHACIGNILAMDSVGLDVAVRPVKLNDAKPEVPQRIKELVSKDASDCDILIMHVLPNFFEYSGAFKKVIGAFAVESNSIPQEWVDKCNLLDELWVFCPHNKEVLERCGVTKPVYVVPHAFDASRYQQTVPPASFRKDYPDDFIFYAVGELNARKGWDLLLRAFYSEFDKDEPVQLIIKTGVPGQSPEQSRQSVIDMCNDIKTKLRIYPRNEDYKDTLIITDYLDQTGLDALHQSCDAIVSASRGEACCLPLCDGLFWGRTVVAPDSTAFPYYLGNYFYRVECIHQNCFAIASVPGLHTGKEICMEPSVIDLREKMRMAYENSENDKSVQQYNKDRINKFSYSAVGNIIKERLV